MAKKWNDPLQRLLEADQKASNVKEYINSITSDSFDSFDEIDNQSSSYQQGSLATNSIIDLDPDQIVRWKHKDRPENELGDLTELAQTFKSIGQQQPCIVRPISSDIDKYELIVGERRWRAAQIAGLKLKVIIQDINDKTAALIQAVENEKRNDLSEFAKGMSFAEKIDLGLLNQKDLTEILGISKQQVSRLLSYRKIPKELFSAIGDFQKVSARTAYELVRLSSKGDEYVEILIELADKIRSGKCGHKSINNEINNVLENKKNIINSNQKVFNVDGRHLFTWRLDNNSTPSIHFPKDIVKLINSDIINIQDLTQEIKECIAKKLAEI